MRASAMPEWMSNEVTRLTQKLERYNPTSNGYNRIQSIRLSKSVTQMLNNPLAAAAVVAKGDCSAACLAHRSRGVLSCSDAEWEEVYPAVKFSRQQSSESACSSESENKFAHYRNCATRIA